MPDKNKYFEAVGRRKTSSARVRLFASTNSTYDINGRKLDEYFHTQEMQSLVKSVFDKVPELKFKVTAKITGGGIHSQAEALKHGIARTLVLVNPELKTPLRKEGSLTRDSRSKERRKFGLKKARKSPQWSKR